MKKRSILDRAADFTNAANAASMQIEALAYLGGEWNDMNMLCDELIRGIEKILDHGLLSAQRLQSIAGAACKQLCGEDK